MEQEAPMSTEAEEEAAAGEEAVTTVAEAMLSGVVRDHTSQDMLRMQAKAGSVEPIKATVEQIEEEVVVAGAGSAMLAPSTASLEMSRGRATDCHRMLRKLAARSAPRTSLTSCSEAMEQSLPLR